MENYFFIATISSIIFYAIYYFFLRKESFHQFNRFYLLGALMASLLIPLVRFSVAMPVLGTKPVSNLSEFITYIQLPEFTVSAQTASWWSFSKLFWGIYISGVLVFTILFIIKIIKISLLIIKSNKNRKGKSIFVEYDENIVPFSFFNYIFINSNAYNQEDNERIILHEQIHVRQRHSWDLIFVELVGIVLWFNPIILLYKRSLQVIHEYLADHRVLQQGIEQGAYLNLLLRQLTLQNEWMLGHHFNYLLTKNRFKMLKNNHYSKWAIARVLFVLPFIALLLMLNCKPKTEQTIEYAITLENMPSESNEEVTYEVDIIQGEDNVQKINVKKTEEPVRFTEEMPEPIGGFDAMYKFLADNLKYPEAARNSGISGQVFIEFVVEKDGSISNAKVLKGADPELDAEALRVVRIMPKWKPGKQMGKPVRTFYQIPVRFAIN
ncbi:MAG: M56 family metallopeptidase [Lentimicrobiaceae bacterium]|nr:M56 family metallopeptidase [Lentimicrobiaceae bacterium]